MKTAEELIDLLKDIATSERLPFDEHFKIMETLENAMHELADKRAKLERVRERLAICIESRKYKHIYCWRTPCLLCETLKEIE